MNDDRRQKDAAASTDARPAKVPAASPTSDPPTPDSGLHAALDALLPSLAPEPAHRPVPAPPTARRAPSPVEPPPASIPVASDSVQPVAEPRVDAAPGSFDAGALAAYRAIVRRTPPALRRPDVAFGAPEERARGELLEHLAARCTPDERARLLVASAEAWQRAGEPAHARNLYEQAESDRADDPTVLRELRKYALAERDIARAAELLAREAALPMAPAERALAWLLLAELELVQRADRAAAERAAAQSFEAQPSLAAALLLHMLHARAGRDRDAAEALRRAAALWPDPRAQSALLLLAARLLFRAGEPVAAQVLCQRAHNADATALDALLCWVRSARERADVRGAPEALERLQGALGSPELSEHALRARARLLDVAGDGAAGLLLLSTASSLPSLRLRARLAETTAQPGERRAALERWAELAGGTDRALALAGLAELHLARADLPAAQLAIDQAIAADPASALVRTLQAAVARAAPGNARLPARAGGDDGERLEAAARLAANARSTGQEQTLLSALETATATATALALDVAAELGDVSKVEAAIAHEARQLAGAQRIGLELMLREVASTAARAEAGAETPSELPSRAPSSALGWLQHAHAAPDAASAGAAWLELSALTGGEIGACAATLAGDYLAASGRAREAYERALAALPGHAPACWSLEPILLERDDLPALRRVHAALARATRDPVERAARSARAAAADPSDGDARRDAWQELAALCHVDALLCDQHLRVAGERDQLALADALEAAGHGAGGPLADLAALRAAVIYEHGAEPARAAVLYREVRDRTSSAGAHAEVGLERTLAVAGLSALLADQLERARVTAANGPARRAATERLALHHVASGNEAGAVPVFRELRDLEPAHVAALRALQRDAMRENDLGELGESSEALAARTRDPRERAAQLRLAARTRALRGEPPRPMHGGPNGDLGLWHTVELERHARRRDDGQLTAQAVLLLCAHLPDANQRASYAMRAAEALEPLSPALAIEALQPQAVAAPRHPLAFEMLARLRQSAGDIAQAAADYEHAASVSPAPQRSARLWYRAATLWQELSADSMRVRAALEQVMRIDPLYRDAFARLRQLLSGPGDREQLAALYDSRIAAGGEPGVLAALHVERSRLLVQLGDEAGARQALADALVLEPHRADALRTAADLDIAAGRLREAAESLIQLARVARDRDVLRACFLELGRIYSEHLPDLRRAEIAYARAVSLAPNDVTALEQLMQVLCRRRDHEKALQTCERLIDLARDDTEIDRRTVELAAIFEDMGDARRAERALNARRERSPGAPAILAALVDLYARQRDHTALAVHLDRSIHALRDALQTHPGDAQRWSTLCEVLSRRGRTDAAACAGALARELGAADAQVERMAAARQAMGPAALTADTVTRVWPDVARDPARPLLRWLEPWADELLPTPAMQRIDAPPPALQAAARAARAALGLPEIALFAMPGSGCVPLRNKPIAIAVGRQLLATCNDEELAFLLVRAAAAARLGLLVAARSDPQELGALLTAVRVDGAAKEDTGDADLLAQLARERIEQRLNPKRKSELHALVARVAVEGATLHSHALELGARVALVATGALGPALCALAACGADETAGDFEQHEPLLALEDAGARALLRFALSEAYMDLHSSAAGGSRSGAAR